MKIAELTDPAAVERAIKEYDELGRDAFLHRYGFGPAVFYDLVHAGRKYDPKAIAGVAYGYQYPDRGPLTCKQFHSGKDTIRALDRMGFSVVHRPGTD
ncbi:MAG: hypothetical protein ACRDOI_06030 [Trebonia sp.]